MGMNIWNLSLNFTNKLLVKYYFRKMRNVSVDFCQVDWSACQIKKITIQNLNQPFSTYVQTKTWTCFVYMHFWLNHLVTTNICCWAICGVDVTLYCPRSKAAPKWNALSWKVFQEWHVLLVLKQKESKKQFLKS